jgi:hypothetical protein
LTRQLAMLASVVGPSAYSAITASVIAASGMWLQSSVIAFKGQAPRLISTALASVRMSAPIARAASMKRMSPWIEAWPTPSMRMGFFVAAIAPRAMKYEADDASPSTCTSPGEQYALLAGTTKRCQPSRCTVMPKRASSASVIST